jgi:hypothetical protein
MRRNTILFVFVGLFVCTGKSLAQQDTASLAGISRLFGTTKFKVDTTAPPNDSLTAKIRMVRAERGAFNIENVIRLSIQGQRSNDTTHSKEYYDRLLEECQHGAAHRLIENVLINLYRQCFTAEEVDELVKFYKTSAGKKTWSDFLILSVTGAGAAEKIVKAAAEKLSSEMKKAGTLK